MRWTGLKHRLEQKLCADLAGRLSFHKTVYRTTHYDDGRAWITVDGEEIFSACTFESWRREHVLAVLELGYPESTAAEEGSMNLPGYNAARTHVEARRRAEGLLTSSEFSDRAFKFLSLPFDEALASDDAMIRGLTIIDRRLGRRRLEAMTPPSVAPAAPLFALRCGLGATQSHSTPSLST